MNLMNDYVIRYGNEESIERTFYDSITIQRKRFEEMKKDNSVIWAELIHEPLNEPEVQHIVDSFEKQVVDILGKKLVINL